MSIPEEGSSCIEDVGKYLLLQLFHEDAKVQISTSCGRTFKEMNVSLFDPGALTLVREKVDELSMKCRWLGFQ